VTKWETEKGYRMRVFISFDWRDSDLAAQLESALKNHGIDAWSRLDSVPGEDWQRVLDQKSASADGIVFLLEAGASGSPQLLAEWRSLLRTDWESKKRLVPVVHGRRLTREELPPFLRNRQPIYTTNFEAMIDHLLSVLEQPNEVLDPAHQQQARIEQEKRLKDLKEYALALKEESSGDDKHQ
jgi:hypothetical protein